MELAAKLLRILADSAASLILELHDPIELFGVNSVGVVDETRGIGHRNDLGSQFIELFNRVLCHVP